MYNQFEPVTQSEKNEELLVRLVMNSGMTQSEQSARNMLIALMLICFMIMGIIIYRSNKVVPFSVSQEQIDAALRNTNQ